MTDAECVRFLQWALPQLGLRWQGYRKVRRQVCKRVTRRMKELELADLAAYATFLDEYPEEWRTLDSLTCITISRFYRDRGVFAVLVGEVLPELARSAEAGELSAWSVGCASGEEAYTLSIAWALDVSRHFPEVELRILGTDVDHASLRRAREACYRPSSLKELPAEWRGTAFTQAGDLACLREQYKRPVSLLEHDLRRGVPDGPFDLILCRYLAFTYFDTQAQLEAGALLADALRPGGILVLGTHERLPEGARGFVPWPGQELIYRREPTPVAAGAAP